MKDLAERLRQENERLKDELSTVRREIENCKQSEKTYRNLFEDAPVGYHELNTDGIILRVNRTEAGMLGYQQNEMIGQPIFDFIYEEHRSVARQFFHEKIKNWRPVIGFSRKYQTHSGREIDVYITDQIVYDDQLNIICIRSILRPISGESNKIGYHEVDSSGIILQVSETEAKLLGYRQNEMIGKPIFDFIAPSEREVARKAFQEKTAHWVPTYGFERRYQHKNGKWVDVMIVDRPVYDDKNIIVGIRSTIQEITEFKKVQQERDQLMNELSDALRRIQTLSGLVPICASCKKIRDDQGYWRDVEAYVAKHSGAEFSNGICPDCMKKLYPEEYARILSRERKAKTSQ
ncbi:MAG TPA: PAS domain S-box protein [Candidatus Marinimicrobia bacterium]|nr:PAS domain S-box protein [Candidatus Neomarinimicrobiota bacterium]